MAQFLRPISTITATNFTGGFADIDETTFSDADFAYSANNTTATLAVGITSASEPNVGTKTIRYRIARTNAGVVDGAGSASTVTASLLQGTTTIATDAVRTASGTWTQYDWVVDTSTVTNWTTLRLQFDVVGGGGAASSRRGAGISWAEMEIPDAPVYGIGTGSSSGVGLATGTEVATGRFAGSSTSTGVATGTQVATGQFAGSSSGVGGAATQGVGLCITTGTSLSVSIASGISIYQPGELTSLVSDVGWAAVPTTSTTLTAVSEGFTNDSDYVVSTQIATQQELIYGIEPLGIGGVAVKVRSKVTKTTGSMTVSLLNNSTVVYTFAETPLTTTLSEYVLEGTISQPANRIRIQVVEI